MRDQATPNHPSDNGRLLDIGRLRLLREVSLRGNISAAARALGLTSSAVSQQLAALEREVGASLLDRSTRGVTLTGAGSALVGRTDELLDLLHSARAEVEELAGVTTGVVSIAAVASAAATLVSAAAVELRTSNPGIDLRVKDAEPAESMNLLVAGDVDIAIVDQYDYVPVALPDFVVTRALLDEPLTVVGPKGRLPRTTVHLGDLAEARWVLPPESAACGMAVRSACRVLGFEPAVHWETDDLRLLVDSVTAGHGVSVLPELALGHDRSGLDVARLRDHPIHRRLLSVARSSVLARPVVSAVVKALEKEAKQVARNRTTTRKPRTGAP